MRAREQGNGDPVGTRVILECGHRLPVPWSLSPEAAVAEVLHHLAVCEHDLGLPVSAGILPTSPVWLPFPEAHR
ncbi:MAG TPA: hypothetical protein VEH10_04460 [Thermoplasmata archaeon]|nr:hypothetical protein [Thermoplasmata archaeon]